LHPLGRLQPAPPPRGGGPYRRTWASAVGMIDASPMSMPTRAARQGSEPRATPGRSALP
jgi:hypothetical protein